MSACLSVFVCCYTIWPQLSKHWLIRIAKENFRHLQQKSMSQMFIECWMAILRSVHCQERSSKMHLFQELVFEKGLISFNQRMLKAPPLKSSDLHILVFQNGPNRGAFICSKICSKSYKIRKRSKMVILTDIVIKGRTITL